MCTCRCPPPNGNSLSNKFEERLSLLPDTNKNCISNAILFLDPGFDAAIPPVCCTYKRYYSIYHVVLTLSACKSMTMDYHVRRALKHVYKRKRRKSLVHALRGKKFSSCVFQSNRCFWSEMWLVRLSWVPLLALGKIGCRCL
jgi:hypothetical protein